MHEFTSSRGIQLVTARTYFSISNNTAGEFLAELAMRHRDAVLGRTQKVASENLRQLGSFMSEHQETIGWIPPRGGMTAFPWLTSGEDSRAFSQAAAVAYDKIRHSDRSTHSGKLVAWRSSRRQLSTPGAHFNL
jgi:hypothetical protein